MAPQRQRLLFLNMTNRCRSRPTPEIALKRSISFYQNRAKPVMEKPEICSYTAIMDFNDFPPEIIMMILSHLTRRDLYIVAKVSKRMRRLAFDPTLWTEIYLDGVSPDEMCKILKRSTCARKIYFNTQSDFSWMQSLPKCYSVNQLNFLDCGLPGGFVSRLVNLYPRVSEVTIVDCHINVSNIGDIAKWEFLKGIDLYNCDVRKYDVHHDDEINDYYQVNDHYNIDDDECVVLIAEKCKNLEELDLVGTFMHITDRAFLTLTKLRGAQLKYLSLYCDKLTSVSYQALKCCPGLKHLHLCGNRGMTAADKEVVDNLKFLDDVYLEHDGRGH